MITAKQFVRLERRLRKAGLLDYDSKVRLVCGLLWSGSITGAYCEEDINFLSQLGYLVKIDPALEPVWYTVVKPRTEDVE